MLHLDADRRPTAETALAHKYLSEYADITDEPTADPFDDSFEVIIIIYRKKICSILIKFNLKFRKKKCQQMNGKVSYKKNIKIIITIN